MSLARLVRKVHVVAGLASFPLVLLFAASGLMLNHRWAIWEFWPQRVERARDIRVGLLAMALGTGVTAAVLWMLCR